MQNLIEAIFKIHKSGLLGRSVKIFKKNKTKLPTKEHFVCFKKAFCNERNEQFITRCYWKSSKIPHEKQYKLQIIVLVQQKTDAVSWFFFTGSTSCLIGVLHNYTIYIFESMSQLVIFL